MKKGRNSSRSQKVVRSIHNRGDADQSNKKKKCIVLGSQEGMCVRSIHNRSDADQSNKRKEKNSASY